MNQQNMHTISCLIPSEDGYWQHLTLREIEAGAGLAGSPEISLYPLGKLLLHPESWYLFFSEMTPPRLPPALTFSN